MVPVPISARNSHSSRILCALLSVVLKYAPRLLPSNFLVDSIDRHAQPLLLKRDSQFDRHDVKSIVFAVLIPVLVLMSGLFAGLTLGYMSLDETQLNVLSISGTPKQREYANKIKPIRKNGHLLLVTLLLSNMIVNESLPVIADPVLGGGFQSVIVSTVLIVIFSEIIPQSLFTRHGLYLGAKMAKFTQILIYIMGIIAWPVAKLLEFVLGPHHGIIYRRSELKELIAMHSSHATLGGDLKTDTVTIIGATLDLQEKVVKQAMTPIADVFMLSIDSKLDYSLLKKIVQTGHSRVPVYEEVDVPMSVTSSDGTILPSKGQPRTQRVKKIMGILLVKQCVLLDPNDATPLRKIPLNKVPFVPNNEPLLGILDKFQEGRSHMAIVSRFSVEKAASVKKAVKRGLTQRLRERVGMGDSESDTESDNSDDGKNSNGGKKSRGRKGIKNSFKKSDVEEGNEDGETLKDHADEKESAAASSSEGDKEHRDVTNKDYSGAILKASAEGSAMATHEGRKNKRTSFQLQIPIVATGMMTSMSTLEQSMPADAVLAKEGAEEFLQSFDPAVMPLGIITLEDVLEELIGEEIYDEFDPQGARGDPYEVPPVQTAPVSTPISSDPSPVKPTSLKPLALKGLGFLRSRSAPPSPRDYNEQRVRSSETVDDSALDDYDESSVHPLAHVEMTHKRGRQPSVIMEQHSSSSTIDSNSPSHNPPPVLPALRSEDGSVKPNIVSMPIPQVVVQSPPILAPIPMALQHISPGPRSASPAASLEAVLLDRKRRLAGAATPPVASGSSATNVVATHKPDGIVTPVPIAINRSFTSTKGARFKSSPLGGLDRTGVVVAEMVKNQSSTTGSEGGMENLGQATKDETKNMKD